MNVLGIDLGASSGRVVLCAFNGEKISLNETYRFHNNPVDINGSEYWDVLRLFQQMKKGISKSILTGKEIVSLGIDTWGVDFGLFDKDKELLVNPCYYLDKRSVGMLDKLYGVFDQQQLLQLTGGYIHPFGTLCQLYSMIERKPETINHADEFLLMPGIFEFFLTGEMSNEYTAASTTNLLAPETNQWLTGVMDKIGLPSRIFKKIVPSGAIKGKVTKQIENELSADGIKVISVASHDTASAVASIPVVEEEFFFISSGTCSIIGINVEKPIINEKAIWDFVNEGGLNGRKRFVKNIMGMFYFQQCKAFWVSKGKAVSYQGMQDSAGQQVLFKNFIDLEDDDLISPGNMPVKIAAYCRRTGQEVPESVGEFAQCITQSLAMFYRYYFEKLGEAYKNDFDTVYIVGGGVENKLLCQYTANATKKIVRAVSVEAAVLGNALVQLEALGELNGDMDRKRVIENSAPVYQYLPKDTEAWDNAYTAFRNTVIGNRIK